MATLTPALFQRLHPNPFLAKFIAAQLRPDGRPTTATVESRFRDTTLNHGSISTAPSSALVRIGNTALLCAITLELAPTEIVNPDQGFLVPNIHLSPLCSALFRTGPPSDEAQRLSHRLRDILLAAGLVNLEELCVQKGKTAFVLFLDVVVLNYDGSILDAALLAAVSSLQHLRLPESVWDPDTGLTTCVPLSPTSPGRALNLNPLPYCFSFGVFNGTLLPDPTHFEAELCTTTLSIALLPSDTSSTPRLLNIYQAGAPLGSELSRSLIQECISLSQSRVQELALLLAGK